MSHTGDREILRVGLIGVGAWALAAHVPALRATGRVRIVALASRDAERAGQLARQLGSQVDPVEPYSDWRAMIASLDVDAVVVTSPPAVHAEQVLEAVRHGKSTLCEAPLATTVRTARELAAAARSRRVVGGTTRPRAFSFGGAAAREALAEGAIGEVRSARLELLGDPWQRADPEASWRPGGADGPAPRALLVASLLIEFFGTPDTLEGTVAVERDEGGKPAARVQLTATAAEGVAIEALAGPAEETSMFLDVMGSDGTLRWELGDGGSVTVTSNRGQEASVAAAGAERFTAPAEFVEAALANRQHALDFDRAAAELELIEQLNSA